MQSGFGKDYGLAAAIEESVRRIDARTGAIERQMLVFHTTLRYHGEELDEHRGRLEALENTEPLKEVGAPNSRIAALTHGQAPQRGPISPPFDMNGPTWHIQQHMIRVIWDCDGAPHPKRIANSVALCDLLACRDKNMSEETKHQNGREEAIIGEIISLEREYYFEKRNVKTERQRKLRELIERHTKIGDAADDS